MSMNFCSLASGSSGNCQYVSSEKTHLLVDAGLSGKYIKNALENIDVDPEQIHGILISHEHSDHVKGVGVLMRRYGVKLYVNELTWNAMKHRVGEVNEEDIVFFESNKGIKIGDIDVKPFSISHDAADPVGFTFAVESAKVCVATDLGVADDVIVEEISDCDLLMIEANHDEEMLKMGKYPYYLKRRILSEDGHISNEYAGGLVVEAARAGRVNQVLLGHLSKENNFPELAYETVRQVVENSEIEVGVDLNIDMTYRDRVSRLYKIKKV